MLWYTIINIVVCIVAVFTVLGIYRKDKKLQEEQEDLIRQQNDIGMCDNCENLKIKCAPGDRYDSYRYKCKFYRFDYQPSACGDYKPKDCNYGKKPKG